MIRVATVGDEDRIEVFLKKHRETSMFLRGNLLRHGLDNREHPHGTTYFLDEIEEEVRNIVGQAKGGPLMCQFPNDSDEFWGDLKRNLKGRELSIITGNADQVGRLKREFGLMNSEFDLDVVEPLYRLQLSNLVWRGVNEGELKTPVAEDMALLIDWFSTYRAETLGQPESSELRAGAEEQATQLMAQNAIRLLKIDGKPVSVTSFNAQLPDMVQVGGVFTPKEMRNRGFARTVVAMHLAEAVTTGVKTAILFASCEPACRAYEAIGFERVVPSEYPFWPPNISFERKPARRNWMPAVLVTIWPLSPGTLS